jgi:peptidoglycan/LPS O-acetylase OafA/YrhL
MLNSLQACRAVVAVIIVTAHTYNGIFSKYFGYSELRSLSQFMHGGVLFFFVLSGFLIPYAHRHDIGKPGELAGYCWKRYSRVFPLYWCLFAVVLPIYFLVPQFGKGYERDWDTVLASALLLPHAEGHSVIGVAWTLPYEMLFYALFGTVVLNKRLGIAVLALWTAGIFTTSQAAGFPVSFVFHPFHLYIIAGMVLCSVFLRYRIPAPLFLAVGGVASFIAWGVIEIHFGLTGWASVFAHSLSCTMIIGGFAELDRSALIRPPKLLVELGNATYSIYLLHFTALSVIAKVGKAAQLDHYVPHWILFVLYVVLAVSCGWLCSRWLEMPLYRWTKRFFSKSASSVGIAKPALRPIASQAA